MSYRVDARNILKAVTVRFL